MIPRILIAGYDDAEDLLAAAPDNFDHVISINDPKVDPPETLDGHRARKLILHFHDVIGARRDRDSRTAPTRDDVQKIIDFAADIKKEHRVLIHCAMGISRSSAAAFAVVAVAITRIAINRDNALVVCRVLRKLKPDIHPNQHMVQFIDDILGWSGVLFSVYEEFFGTLSDPLEGLAGIDDDE